VFPYDQRGAFSTTTTTIPIENPNKSKMGGVRYAVCNVQCAVCGVRKWRSRSELVIDNRE
jgi:hypothetical protein